MLALDIIGAELAPAAPSPEEIKRLCELALASRGVQSGHLAVHFVSAEAIAELNRAHRGRTGPTDVLSFPIDGTGPSAGPRELGDVMVCPVHTASVPEAIVHGVLHLLGMDHETDAGQMLALQAQLLGEGS
ncbi:MAG TPA: rRNA maturation RNase YbeY [Solirubrobacteraceae bacterium]|nr:rRNA maturation RNase YbeY [Solirubrobacteraceae bacterium]